MSDGKVPYQNPSQTDLNLDAEIVQNLAAEIVYRERVVTYEGGNKTIVSGGPVNSTTPNTAVPLTSNPTPCNHVTVAARPDNQGNIYIGGSGVDANSFVGIPLAPGGYYDLSIDDLSKVFFDVLNSGDGVSFNYFTSH